MMTSPALTRFLDTWEEAHIVNDLARQLTCDEVDDLAALFEAHNRPTAAQGWIEAHSYGDDEGDAHWRTAD